MSGFNNDTGVMDASYLIGGPVSGVRLKAAAGPVAEVRNTPDTAYADAYAGNIRANNPTVGGADGGALIANGLIRHGTGVQSYGIGNGAIIGSARGVGAIDLQADRTAAAMVASGARSLCGGQSSRATADDALSYGFLAIASGVAAVALGSNLLASGPQAFCAGDNNTASGDQSVALGEFCTASGHQSAAIGRINVASGLASVAFGFGCQATGDYSTTFGNGARADARGMLAFSGGNVTAAGDNQTCLVTWGRRTLDAVATIAGLDGLGAVELDLPADASYAFELLVSAEVAGGTAAKVWTITGGIRRPGAGAAVFVGGAAPVAVVVAGDAALALATVVVSAPGGGTLRVTVTGVAATTVQWTIAGWIARSTG